MPSQQPLPSATQVFTTFLRLGLTSFGGPVAHLGYFHQELVIRRRWLTQGDFADLLALCQFLPGPASSQLGFAIGLRCAGWRGAIAAFLGFTLPSALILFLLAMGAATWTGPIAMGAMDGLKIMAVAIVAQAVLGMAQNLCPDGPRALIAVTVVAILAFAPGPAAMALTMLFGAGLGFALLKNLPAPTTQLTTPHMMSRRQGLLALALFAAILLIAPLLAGYTPALALFDSFTRAGALVFGGGHVVLPLLEAEMVQTGRLTQDSFLTGYGLAQAVPGPLFTFAAWLGALSPPGGALGAAITLLAIFLPGFLILIAALPFWTGLCRNPRAQRLLAGANAAVVGILAAALYDPVFTGAIHDPRDFALALICFAALIVWKAPPWAVVIAATLGGMGLSLLP